MSKTILVTGATSGIGQACVHRFAKEGHNIILTGRRSQRLNDLVDKLISAYAGNYIALNFDVRNREEVREAINSLPEAFSKIDILVNNAGLAAGANKIQDGNYQHWERMIDTNLKGLLYVSEAVIPQMVARNGGMIINIDSTAGKEAYPGGNVYCATKHGVDALTKGMRMDLLEHKIKVGMVSPGLVETEFSIVRFDGDEEKAKKVYSGMTPLRPEDVAESVYFMASQPDHVSILDIVIMPSDQASSTQVRRS